MFGRIDDLEPNGICCSMDAAISYLGFIVSAYPAVFMAHRARDVHHRHYLIIPLGDMGE